MLHNRDRVHSIPTRAATMIPHFIFDVNPRRSEVSGGCHTTPSPPQAVFSYLHDTVFTIEA